MSFEDGKCGRELIKACIEFDEFVLYTRYSNEYYFYLDIPGLEHPAVGSIMGSVGDEFGLTRFQKRSKISLLPPKHLYNIIPIDGVSS